MSTSEGGARALPRSWRGRSSGEWAEALGVPALEIHSTLPSTSVRLRQWAKEGASPFAAVVADEQTRGRGREGRAWHSPADTGLWISVLVPLDGPGGVLPLAAGVAVAFAVERASGVATSLKWPNDVLVGDRKVAGVLCESAGDAGRLVAVGIGVNLRPPPTGLPGELSSSAGFLSDVSGRSVREPDLAARLIEEIRRWTRPTPFAFSGRLRAEWESRDCLRGRTVRTEAGAVGVVREVSSEGALHLATSDGSIFAVRAGSVRIEGEGESSALYAGGSPDSHGR